MLFPVIEISNPDTSAMKTLSPNDSTKTGMGLMSLAIGELVDSQLDLFRSCPFLPGGRRCLRAELREPLGSGSAITGVCGSSRVTATSPTGEGELLS
jgi:hypothetical protein